MKRMKEFNQEKDIERQLELQRKQQEHEDRLAAFTREKDRVLRKQKFQNDRTRQQAFESVKLKRSMHEQERQQDLHSKIKERADRKQQMEEEWEQTLASNDWNRYLDTFTRKLEHKHQERIDALAKMSKYCETMEKRTETYLIRYLRGVDGVAELIRDTRLQNGYVESDSDSEEEKKKKEQALDPRQEAIRVLKEARRVAAEQKARMDAKRKVEEEAKRRRDEHRETFNKLKSDKLEQDLLQFLEIEENAKKMKKKRLQKEKRRARQALRRRQQAMQEREEMLRNAKDEASLFAQQKEDEAQAKVERAKFIKSKQLAELKEKHHKEAAFVHYRQSEMKQSYALWEEKFRVAIESKQRIEDMRLEQVAQQRAAKNELRRLARNQKLQKVREHKTQRDQEHLERLTQSIEEREKTRKEKLKELVENHNMALKWLKTSSGAALVKSLPELRVLQQRVDRNPNKNLSMRLRARNGKHHTLSAPSSPRANRPSSVGGQRDGGFFGTGDDDYSSGEDNEHGMTQSEPGLKRSNSLPMLQDMEMAAGILSLGLADRPEPSKFVKAKTMKAEMPKLQSKQDRIHSLAANPNDLMIVSELDKEEESEDDDEDEDEDDSSSDEHESYVRRRSALVTADKSVGFKQDPTDISPRSGEKKAKWDILGGYVGPKRPANISLATAQDFQKTAIKRFPYVEEPSQPGMPCKKDFVYLRENRFSDALVYLKLRKDGCSQDDALGFTAANRCRFDATCLFDGPPNHRSLRRVPNSKDGPVVNGWQFHKPLFDLGPDFSMYEVRPSAAEEQVEKQSKDKDKVPVQTKTIPHAVVQRSVSTHKQERVSSAPESPSKTSRSSTMTPPPKTMAKSSSTPILKSQQRQHLSKAEIEQQLKEKQEEAAARMQKKIDEAARRKEELDRIKIQNLKQEAEEKSKIRQKALAREAQVLEAKAKKRIETHHKSLQEHHERAVKGKEAKLQQIKQQNLVNNTAKGEKQKEPGPEELSAIEHEIALRQQVAEYKRTLQLRFVKEYHNRRLAGIPERLHQVRKESAAQRLYREQELEVAQKEIEQRLQVINDEMHRKFEDKKMSREKGERLVRNTKELMEKVLVERMEDYGPAAREEFQLELSKKEQEKSAQLERSVKHALARTEERRRQKEAEDPIPTTESKYATSEGTLPRVKSYDSLSRSPKLSPKASPQAVPTSPVTRFISSLPSVYHRDKPNGPTATENKLPPEPLKQSKTLMQSTPLTPIRGHMSIPKEPSFKTSLAHLAIDESDLPQPEAGDSVVTSPIMSPLMSTSHTLVKGMQAVNASAVRRPSVTFVGV
eukprot:GILJ01008607.1.p1 GENE.GILJ01008607.1~~GILJ01008607.1.p1  ORF type:complete len:1459 (-),score=298.70 GILJ01008607.1:103-4029(-)